MKTDIHPTYYQNATITCACGSVTKVGSTVENIHIEICSNCHPFFTGKQKLIDTARRVDKFEKRMSQKEALSKTRIGRKAKKARLAEKKTAKASSRKSTSEK